MVIRFPVHRKRSLASFQGSNFCQGSSYFNWGWRTISSWKQRSSVGDVLLETMCPRGGWPFWSHCRFQMMWHRLKLRTFFPRAIISLSFNILQDMVLSKPWEEVRLTQWKLPLPPDRCEIDSLIDRGSQHNKKRPHPSYSASWDSSLLSAKTIKYRPCLLCNPPQPNPPPLLYFLFWKARNPSKEATSLNCHLWVRSGSVSFPNTITGLTAVQFPSLLIPIHLFYTWIIKSHTEGHVLRTYLLITPCCLVLLSTSESLFCFFVTVLWVSSMQFTSQQVFLLRLAVG